MVHSYVKIVIRMITIVTVVYCGFDAGQYFPAWYLYTRHPNLGSVVQALNGAGIGLVVIKRILFPTTAINIGSVIWNNLIM